MISSKMEIDPWEKTITGIAMKFSDLEDLDISRKLNFPEAFFSESSFEEQIFGQEYFKVKLDYKWEYADTGEVIDTFEITEDIVTSHMIIEDIRLSYSFYEKNADNK